MRFAVLAQPDSWYAADLIRAARPRHQVVVASFARVSASLERDGGWSVTADQVRLNDFDAVLVRTMPPGSLEQVVFRMDALGRLAAGGVAVVNPPRALEAAVDKYLASSLLHAAGIPTVPTNVCQTFDDAMWAFERLGGDVVVKPLFGSEGRGIVRVSDASVALRVFKTLAQLNAVLYLQPFIAHHGHDIRLFVLGDRVLGMKRSSQDDWRTNVSCGATTEPFHVDATLSDLARRATDAVGARIAGVDVLPDVEGNLYVLEVNAVPGWRALARTLNRDIAAEILEFITHRVLGDLSTEPA